MAKVGEGDPRWIVNERKDGANVNAWHWEERDLSEHTKQSITKALTNKKFAENVDDVEYIQVEEVADFSGDVTVAQRKGRMMCYFEIKFTAKWVGKTTSGEEVKGKMEVPEVDHDEFVNDFEVSVSCQENSAAAHKIEDLVRINGRKAIREAVQQFFKKIFEEYHIGQTLKSGASMPPPPVVAPAAKPATAERTNKKESAGTSGSGSFSWKMRWRAPIEDLFLTLTDGNRASMYTRRPAAIDAKEGGQFQFLGGVISGYFVQLSAPTTIKSQWRLSSWDAGVHSSVVMQLTKEEPGVTTLEFAQSGIPSGQVESVKEGWRANFFDAIKVVFGYSVEYL
eukprot:gene12516-8571_t